MISKEVIRHPKIKESKRNSKFNPIETTINQFNQPPNSRASNSVFKIIALL